AAGCSGGPAEGSQCRLAAAQPWPPPPSHYRRQCGARRRSAGGDAGHSGLRRGPAVRRAAGRRPACLAGEAPGRTARRADHPGAAAMTADARKLPPAVAPGREARPGWPPLPALRLVRLHLASRRVPTALAAVAGCAAVLRVALHWHWDAYGALQLPLIFEAGCAAVIAVTAGSPFGEPERAAGRCLPSLPVGTALALPAAAPGALAAAGTGAPMAGGPLYVLR